MCPSTSEETEKKKKGAVVRSLVETLCFRPFVYFMLMNGFNYLSAQVQEVFTIIIQADTHLYPMDARVTVFWDLATVESTNNGHIWVVVVLI